MNSDLRQVNPLKPTRPRRPTATCTPLRAFLTQHACADLVQAVSHDLTPGQTRPGSLQQRRSHLAARMWRSHTWNTKTAPAAARVPPPETQSCGCFFFPSPGVVTSSPLRARSDEIESGGSIFWLRCDFLCGRLRRCSPRPPFKSRLRVRVAQFPRDIPSIHAVSVSVT